MRKTLPCALLLLLVFSPALLARGRPRGPAPVPEAEVTAERDLEKLAVAEPAGTIAYLYTPKSLLEGEKGGMVVMLHGHGGTATGVVLRDLAESMGWLYLSVQGGGNVDTPQGPGHTWSGPDTKRAIAATRWALANRPVDPERVVLIGFSAGGTMVLSTWPEAPDLYAGIITCSAPRTPGPPHEQARIAVFLGTDDPNYGGAGAVRKAFENRKVGGSLRVIQGSGHNDLPAAPYLATALRWILVKNARGHELTLPKAPPPATEGEYRHVMFAWSSAANAPAGLRRKKTAAKSLATKTQKLIKAGRTWFPHEAQGLSDDRESALTGGRITRARLIELGVDEAKLDKALSRRKEGQAAGPLESEAGYHLLVPVEEE